MGLFPCKRTEEEVAKRLLVKAVLGLHHELRVEREGQVQHILKSHVQAEKDQRHNVLVVRLAPAPRQSRAVVPQPGPVVVVYGGSRLVD